MLSNGHAIITKDANGKFVNNATSSEIIEDCDWAYAFYTEGLTRRAVEGEQWNFFESVFKEQKAVMIPYDEYKASDFSANEKDENGKDTGVKAYDFVYGFVCFPKGPKASDYIPVSRENIMVIPNCETTKAKLADIAFAYNNFTDQSPEIKDDPNAWKGGYEALFRDSRAVNETLDIMINKIAPVQNPSYIIPGLWDNNNGIIQTSFYYNVDSPAQTPGQLLESLNSEIQTKIDEFNARRAK